MMKTVIGQVIGAHGGMARRTYLHRPPARPVAPGAIGLEIPPAEIRTRVFALDAKRMRSTQGDLIEINLEHRRNDVVGTLDYLELRQDGALWGVGTVTLGFPDRVFFSPETTSEPDGSDLVIERVAITAHPAQIVMAPIETFDLDLDGYGQPASAGLSERHAALFTRARAMTKRRCDGEAITVECEPGAPLLLRHGLVDDRPPVGTWIDPDGRPMRTAPTGRASGRVLHVR